jgi:hypothetical protein
MADIRVAVLRELEKSGQFTPEQRAAITNAILAAFHELKMARTHSDDLDRQSPQPAQARDSSHS